MEKKKLQSVSIAALIVSILPLAALAPSLLHLSLSDGVRTAWAGANVVFVLLGLILSVIRSLDRVVAEGKVVLGKEAA